MHGNVQYSYTIDGWADGRMYGWTDEVMATMATMGTEQ